MTTVEKLRASNWMSVSQLPTGVSPATGLRFELQCKRDMCLGTPGAKAIIAAAGGELPDTLPRHEHARPAPPARRRTRRTV